MLDSPEKVALATWSHTPGAEAEVTAVTVDGDRAEVVLTLANGYLDYVYCVHSEGCWHEAVSGNGPVVGWRDRGAIDWIGP